MNKIFLFSFFFFLFSLSGCQEPGKKISGEHPAINTGPPMTKYTIALYGVQAEEHQNEKTKLDEIPGMVLVMKGIKKLTWDVNVQKAGEYNVSVNYSVDQDCTAIEVTHNNKTIAGHLNKPQGYRYASNIWSKLNYEKALLKETLSLTKGMNTIRFTLNQPVPRSILHFRALELNPLSRMNDIQAEVKRAEDSRADLEWMRKAGYGLMFHWTSQSLPEKGPHKSYAEAVRDFDVPAFTDMVENTGAGWVYLTVGHAESYCPAPVKAWEKLNPGQTTKRDLLMELADELNKRNIKFMFYFSGRMAHVGKVTLHEYMENYRKLLSEFGERYGEKCAGYWFDGWSQGYQKYPDFDFEEFMQLCRIGNPNRVYCLNTWVYPPVTSWQDHWAGEVNHPIIPADNPIMTRGAGRGLPYFALLSIEGGWVYRNENSAMGEIRQPKVSGEELADYINNCKANGGVVTINLLITQEGKIGEKAKKMIETVRKIVRDS
jgi:hypothetical protein